MSPVVRAVLEAARAQCAEHADLAWFTACHIVAAQARHQAVLTMEAMQTAPARTQEECLALFDQVLAC